MTGREFIYQSKNDLAEGLSGLTQLQEARYPQHVCTAMDRLARATWCLYRTAVIDLVANQPTYRFPLRPFREMAMNVNDGNGNIWPLTSITPEKADQQFFNWRSAQNTSGGLYPGIPAYSIESGEQSLTLLPVPNYSCEDGLMIGGYYGVSTDWYDMSAESPLDSSMDLAIGYGTMMYRCIEMLAIDPTKYGGLLKIYTDLFEQYIRRSYKEALVKTASRRAGVVSDKANRWSGNGWSFVW